MAWISSRRQVFSIPCRWTVGREAVGLRLRQGPGGPLADHLSSVIPEESQEGEAPAGRYRGRLVRQEAGE